MSKQKKTTRDVTPALFRMSDWTEIAFGKTDIAGIDDRDALHGVVQCVEVTMRRSLDGCRPHIDISARHGGARVPLKYGEPDAEIVALWTQLTEEIGRRQEARPEAAGGELYAALGVK